MHIAVVDQYVPYDPGSAQYQWLEDDLAQSSSCWKILVLHEPGWSADGTHDNNTDVQDFLQPLCLTYGVSIVYAGHNHYYARCEVDGVQHITSGGGGAPLSTCDPTYPNVVTCTNVHQYCEFDVNDTALHFRSIDSTGTEIDQFTLTCGSNLDFNGFSVVDDRCAAGGPGDRNTLVEPGEDITLALTLLNAGSEVASGIQATLSSTTPGVTIAPGRQTASYPAVNPGRSAEGNTPFVFSTDPSVLSCGDVLAFQLEITYTTVHGPRVEAETFSIGIPNPCQSCLQTGCKLGVPDRIARLLLVHRGNDMEFYWPFDPKAEGGYNFYMTETKADIPNLRLENPPPIPDPFAAAGPAQVMPYVYTNGVRSGLTFYQILGVCSDNTTEGPN